MGQWDHLEPVAQAALIHASSPNQAMNDHFIEMALRESTAASLKRIADGLDVIGRMLKQAR